MLRDLRYVRYEESVSVCFSTFFYAQQAIPKSSIEAGHKELHCLVEKANPVDVSVWYLDWCRVHFICVCEIWQPCLLCFR